MLILFFIPELLLRYVHGNVQEWWGRLLEMQTVKSLTLHSFLYLAIFHQPTRMWTFTPGANFPLVFESSDYFVQHIRRCGDNLRAATNWEQRPIERIWYTSKQELQNVSGICKSYDHVIFVYFFNFLPQWKSYLKHSSQEESNIAALTC